MKALLRINGVELPMLVLRKSMTPETLSPYARRRLRQRGSYHFGSARGELKRSNRASTHRAVMAQQAIEGAFKAADMSWRQVEKAMRQRGWPMGEVWRLANIMGVEKIANENFKAMEAA